MRSKICIVLTMVLYLSMSYSNDLESGIKTIKSIDSENEFSAFKTYYYISPRPDLVVSSMKFIIKNKYNNNPNVQRHFVPFYGEIFKSNNDNIKIWFSGIQNLSDNDIYVFSQALHWANNKNSSDQIKLLLSKTQNKDLINGVTEMVGNYKQIDLLNIKLNNVELLDMLWNSFFATGNDKFILKIISATPTNMQDINSIGIFSAARWSLKNNAYTHTRVFEICKNQLSKSSGEMQDILKDIVNK